MCMHTQHTHMCIHAHMHMHRCTNVHTHASHRGTRVHMCAPSTQAHARAHTVHMDAHKSTCKQTCTLSAYICTCTPMCTHTSHRCTQMHMHTDMHTCAQHWVGTIAARGTGQQLCRRQGRPAGGKWVRNSGVPPFPHPGAEAVSEFCFLHGSATGRLTLRLCGRSGAQEGPGPSPRSALASGSRARPAEVRRGPLGMVSGVCAAT